MKYAIIGSKKDIAGMNIRDFLVKSLEEVNGNYSKKENNYEIKLYTIDEDTVFFSKNIDSEIIIFATRHQSKSGEKTLSIHFPGNFYNADFGGESNKLCIAPAKLVKHAFKILNKICKDTEFKITMEATHHGPYMNKPVLFIEIGSKEAEWRNKEAGKIICDTILEAIDTFKHNKNEIAIGFGGTHYCQNFNKIELNSNIAMSHICPKYGIELLSKDMIRQMIEKTVDEVNYAILDWKGLSSSNKSHLIPILEDIGLAWKKTKDVKYL